MGPCRSRQNPLQPPPRLPACLPSSARGHGAALLLLAAACATDFAFFIIVDADGAGRWMKVYPGCHESPLTPLGSVPRALGVPPGSCS